MSARRPLGPSPASLGDNLRAARLGYAWLSALGLWVRISDGPDEAIRIDLAPPRGIPSGRGRGAARDAHYRCWWEHEDEDEPVGPAIATAVQAALCGGGRLKELRSPLALLLNDDGTFNSWLAAA